MKNGAYTCKDERNETATPRCSALVSATLIDHGEGKQSLSIGNFGGSTGVELPWPPRHPDFVDDEATGIVVVPTDLGVVRMKWPTAEDYAAVIEELGDTVEDAPAVDAPEKARQKFLRSLC